jgi:hypothetical protein
VIDSKDAIWHGSRVCGYNGQAASSEGKWIVLCRKCAVKEGIIW